MSLKRCYTCDHTVLDNLNITYNTMNSLIILWNKYEIFVYENLNFNEIIKTIVPDFEIKFLIISNNYLACLDTAGNIYVDALKFKNAAPKRLKTFSKQQENNIGFTLYNTDHILCLKSQPGKLRLCYHHFDVEFKMLEEHTLLYDDDLWPLQTKEKDIILNSYTLSDNYFRDIKTIFNVTEVMQGTYSLLIISLDRRTVYACLFSPKSNNRETALKKLYSCPSEISNIEIIIKDHLYFIIGLKSGTIIKLSLNDNNEKPQIIHLNTAISKLLVFNDTILYTDGLTLWKSENTYSDEIKLTKFFITQLKDFIKLNDQIICTTYTKLIYIFQIDDEECFVKSIADEYCSANKILNNSHYLQRIFDEIEKNNELVKKINEEENYIITMSLSNRQDIMDKIINTKIIVYENYEDAVTENSPLILTESIAEYFKQNTLLMLIKINTNTMHHIVDQILSNLFGDPKIHITFSTDDKIIKTSSVKIVEQLKRVNYLIPLKTKSYRIKVSIRLGIKIPGAHDEKQTVWNVLYEKKISLNPEHFINIEQTNKNIFLKKSGEFLTDLILDCATKQYGNIFKFTDHYKNVTIQSGLGFYIKLPDNFKEVLKTNIYCKSNFSLKKSEFLLQQYSSEEFLNSKNNLLFSIGEDKVTVELLNDSFSSPMLKVCSKNMLIAFDIRNFFANIFYGEFQNSKPGEEYYVKHTFYTIVENHQKALKDCITTRKNYELEQQIANFERDIIGKMPI